MHTYETTTDLKMETNSIHAWWLAARPKTLTGAAAPVMAQPPPTSSSMPCCNPCLSFCNPNPSLCSLQSFSCRSPYTHRRHFLINPIHLYTPIAEHSAMGVLVMGRKGRGERGGFYITFLVHKRVRNWFTGHSSMTLWLGALGWTGPSEEHEGKGTERPKSVTLVFGAHWGFWGTLVIGAHWG